MPHSATALRAPAALVRPAPPPTEQVRLPERPGWYPDPERRATSRFFDGAAWTEHTRGPAPLVALTAAAKARGHGETRAFGRFDNRPASASLVVGAISILVNPLLVPSVVALVLGVRGLRRARLSPVRRGRERALAGIALAATGVATAAVALVALVALLTPAFVQAQHDAQAAAVRTAVAQHLEDRGSALRRLACPPVRPGATVTCAATTAGHVSVPVQVLLPADGSAPRVTDPAPPHRAAHRRHR